MIARVALADVVYAIDKLYDYLVPERLEPEAKVGMRISVPFARGNRRREGLIFELAEKSGFLKLKPIDAFLDGVPVLTEAQLRLARWMKSRFFAPIMRPQRPCFPPASG
jgi:primosomal protein N' (replication factor Y)